MAAPARNCWSGPSARSLSSVLADLPDVTKRLGRQFLKVVGLQFLRPFFVPLLVNEDHAFCARGKGWKNRGDGTAINVGLDSNKLTPVTVDCDRPGALRHRGNSAHVKRKDRTREAGGGRRGRWRSRRCSVPLGRAD